MTDKNEQPSSVEPKSPVPSDADLFDGPVQNDYSAQDIFAGDNSLYQLLTRIQTGTKATAAKIPERLRGMTPRLSRGPGPSFSMLQKVLAGTILGVAIILAYAVFKTPKTTLADANLEPSLDTRMQPPPALVTQEPAESNAVLPRDTAAYSEPVNPQVSEPVALTGPISLQTAQDLFDVGDYGQAYSVYQQIQQYLPPDDKQTAFSDYLTLHKALCLAMNQESIPAKRFLTSVTKSETPSIRVMANYYLSRFQLNQNQFMPARARACEALSLLNALKDQPPEWLADLRQTCCFLAAQATTKQALALRDADSQLPSSLCPNLPMIKSPWHQLNETQVRQALAKEKDLLPAMLLTPSITKNSRTAQTLWSLSCHRMAVDEVLARFGANASLEVVWHEGANHVELRKQAISLFIQDVIDQTAIGLAAGCAGLLAHIDDTHTIHVMNPMNTSLVSAQVDMLAQEAILMWQQYLLFGSESPYFANAHFTSGLLYKLLGIQHEAISEFKLVTSKYSITDLAPYALLYSSQVKEELHDAVGVREDLEQLVEQYVDVPIVTEAFLRLAKTLTRLGNHEEAAKLYRKVFYLNLSDESRTIAALNAGRCFYEIKDYESAQLWLAQYIKLVKGKNDKELSSAFLTLGKSLLGLGNSKLACQAFQHALEGDLDKKEYLETLTSLVRGYMEQQDPMEAIDVLENAFNAQLTSSDIMELDLVKSRVLRNAGFMDRAIGLLQHTKGSVISPSLNAKISFELSLSLIEKGELVDAQQELSSTLIKGEAGPLSHEIALTLAQVCLELNQDDQAISVCEGVLKLGPDPSLVHKASQLLAEAYTHKKNYDKAALALMGQWK
ncbi:MAG: tetratricopeptide repeat protein [Phycisphaerae bacterium]|nr:tetratricopeptide repeat protein [Phycisphaerae bacterium]